MITVCFDETALFHVALPYDSTLRKLRYRDVFFVAICPENTETRFAVDIQLIYECCAINSKVSEANNVLGKDTGWRHKLIAEAEKGLA